MKKSKLLITVTNNLKYDSRVKRHSAFLAGLFDETQVLCLPLPDDTVYLTQDKLRQSFAALPPQDGLEVDLWASAEQLGVLAPLLAAYPFAGLGTDTPPPWYAQACLDAQHTMAQAAGFDLLRGALTGQMPLQQELENLHRLLGGWLHMARQIADIPADVVLCNDLDTLLGGVAHKLRHGSRLVYDAHELYFDIEPTRPPVYKHTLALLERELIQYPDAVMSVGQALVDWLQHSYAFPAPATSIPNCISHLPAAPLPPKQLDPTRIRLYYHGGSDEHRGIEFIIQALPLLDERFSLVLKCTPSDNLPRLQALAQQLGQAERIQWKPPVPAEQIVESCHADGDIALTLPNIPEEGSVVNKVSLTNKFLEYLRAGVPIVSSIHTEHNNIIARYGAGAVARDNSPAAVVDAINQVIASTQGYTAMSAGALRAAADLFDWDSCSQRLRHIFEAVREEQHHGI